MCVGRTLGKSLGELEEMQWWEVELWKAFDLNHGPEHRTDERLKLLVDVLGLCHGVKIKIERETPKAPSSMEEFKRRAIAWMKATGGKVLGR